MIMRADKEESYIKVQNFNLFYNNYISGVYLKIFESLFCTLKLMFKSTIPQ